MEIKKKSSHPINVKQQQCVNVNKKENTFNAEALIIKHGQKNMFTDLHCHASCQELMERCLSAGLLHVTSLPEVKLLE